MASHRGTWAVLQALREALSVRLASLLGGQPTVSILGSQDIAGQPAPAVNTLAIYLHRISVDPLSRNRHLAPLPDRRTPRPELPVNLHLLLIGWCVHPEEEIRLVSAAMQIIGSALPLDSADLVLGDPAWGDRDSVQVQPEEMPLDDLMRLWDSLPGDYRLSAPYMVKTIRLEPVNPRPDGPPVRTVVLPHATHPRNQP
jgi:hypothetical protein